MCKTTGKCLHAAVKRCDVPAIWDSQRYFTLPHLQQKGATRCNVFKFINAKGPVGH